MESNATGFVTHLAESLGTGEQSLRLIASLLVGYPLAFAYRKFLHGRSETLQHLYFIVTGLSICYYNFGNDTIHSAVNIVSIWALITLLGGTALSVGLAFMFNTLYLVYSYYHVTGDDYDISWATPHCVLTLRLTGVVLDVFDGAKPQEKLSVEQKETALQSRPSLLSMAGHVYFFGGFLTGPQFSMKRYQSFVSSKFAKEFGNGPPQNVSLALVRLWLGVLYVAVFQIFCGLVFTETYMLTSDFHNLNFFLKCAYITVWGKLTISKYVGCWLMVEGSCILTGLTYNGQDINGNTLWDGCSNVKVRDFEMVSTLRGVIASFNISTNKWMSRYVFKRLRFLGNIQLSQGCTLLYLSVWHGLHSGYYMNFFLEFIMVNGESQLADLMRRLPRLQQLCSSRTGRPLVWLWGKLMVHFCLGYALVSFVLIKWHRYSQVYSSVYFIGHVIFFVFPVIYYLVKSTLPRAPARETVSNGVHHTSNDQPPKVIKTS